MGLVQSVKQFGRMNARRVMGTIGSVGRTALYDQVERFCLFMGYPRSGSTLSGSLLDAHRHTMIAHEAAIVDYVDAGLTRDQLFWVLMSKNREFVKGGLKWEGYSYEVPGGWQGRCERMRVIGDKKAGVTSQTLGDDSSLLDRLRERVRVPLRMVHVVRNPYDNIATIATRAEVGLDLALARYERFVRCNERVKSRLGREELFEYRHEELISNPMAVLGRMCGYLGLDSPEEYLKGCAGIVFESPRKSRHKVEWPVEIKSGVERLIGEVEFLAGYGFER